MKLTTWRRGARSFGRGSGAIGRLAVRWIALLAAIGAAEAEVVETVAGTGRAGDGVEGAAAREAALNGPFGVIREAGGSVLFCDTFNHRVRRIDGKGVLTTVAGCGRAGYGGDGGPAVEALLNEPYEVRASRAGDLFIVERLNHTVRRVDGRTGMIETLAGTGEAGDSGDGGPAARAALRQPHSIQLTPDESAVLVCDIGNHRIRRIDLATRRITTFAGDGSRGPTPDGAPFRGSPLNGPRAMDFDRDGNLWLSLREGRAIHRLDLAKGTIHHVAGTGRKGFSGNGGPAAEATLSGPLGVAVSPVDGNVYFCDTDNHAVRMIDLAVDPPVIRLVAGTGDAGDGPDGPAADCRFARPHGIFVEPDGGVLVGDTNNHRVRRVSPAR